MSEIEIPTEVELEEAVRTDWLFITKNNPPSNWREWLDVLNATYCIGSLEKGKKGTEHIQAICYFEDRKIVKSFCKKYHCWSRKAKYPGNCVDYCQKEDTHLDGPYVYGVCPKNLKYYKKQKMKVIEYFKQGWDPDQMVDEGIWCITRQDILDKAYYRFFAKKLRLEKPWKTIVKQCWWIHGQTGAGKSVKALEILGEDYYEKTTNKW